MMGRYLKCEHENGEQVSTALHALRRHPHGHHPFPRRFVFGEVGAGSPDFSILVVEYQVGLCTVMLNVSQLPILFCDDGAWNHKKAGPVVKTPEREYIGKFRFGNVKKLLAGKEIATDARSIGL